MPFKSGSNGAKCGKKWHKPDIFLDIARKQSKFYL